MYDIAGQVELTDKMTKTVLRERLIEALQSLDAEVKLSNEDGAIEFKPAPRNRGKHPLKNITFGRINLTVDNSPSLYVTTVSFQLSLVQMRISLVTITVAIWAYSLLRGYMLAIPLAFSILSWLFGYVLALLTIRFRFRAFITTIIQRDELNLKIER